MRWVCIAAVLLTAAPTWAQNIPTFDANGYRMHSKQASGCPSTSCLEGMVSGSGDGSMCRCTSGGSWVDLASVAVGASTGTTNLIWDVNSDGAAGTDEDPVLRMRGGDGAALSTFTATLETTSDVLTFALAGGTFAFGQALAITGGLTLDAVALTATATEINQALAGISGTVTQANLDTLTDTSDADALHTHPSLLPLAGGTMAGSIIVDTDNAYGFGAPPAAWAGIYTRILGSTIGAEAANGSALAIAGGDGGAG